MAEHEGVESVYRLGCGNDLKDIPTERGNLGSDSLATTEPRERVLSSWTSLLKQDIKVHVQLYQGECVISKTSICRSFSFSYPRFLAAKIAEA